MLGAAALLAACHEPDLSDALSKGRCDPKGQCSKGYACVDQECVKQGAGGQAGAGPCDGGCVGPSMECCNEQCVDLANDPENCKTCGSHCPGTHCRNESCLNSDVPDACLPGFLDCNKNVLDGCELQGTVCPSDGGTD